jgi:hypothetical protein
MTLNKTYLSIICQIVSKANEIMPKDCKKSGLIFNFK